MRSLACLALALLSLSTRGQPVPPSDRPVAQFKVTGASRLAALARLGALTNTTLLVEANHLGFLEQPVSVAESHSTVGAVARQILGPDAAYTLRNQGALFIVADAGLRNRLLTVPLGPFHFHGSALSGLHPLLAFSLRQATGCHPSGYGWAGPAMNLDIPPIDLPHATFEQVVARVADAPQASMWIVESEPSSAGCIEDPAAHWQVGLYGFGSGFTGCQTLFRESVGPAFVALVSPAHAFPEDCVLSLAPLGPPPLP